MSIRSLCNRVDEWLNTTLGCIFSAAIVLCLYCALGMLGYQGLSLEPGWSLPNVVYFSTATCATVGYGDLYPSSTASRGFTIFMMVLGVAIVFPIFARAIARALLQPISSKGRALLERLLPQRKIDVRCSSPRARRDFEPRLLQRSWQSRRCLQRS